MDVIVAAIAGTVLLPIMALVGLAVAAAMGRPICFRQMRSGRGGAMFELVKFRTMTQERDAAGLLLEDEQRLTRAGTFLRRCRLDELPQLWNVLRGDMSLIGPRPLLAETIAAMGEPGARRGAVRPGLTGWSQVNGNTLLSDAEKLELDLWYIENQSLRLDLLILVRTLKVLVIGERRTKGGARGLRACAPSS